MRSLRARVLTITSAACAAVLGVLLLVLHAWLADHLRTEFDDSLKSKAYLLALLVELNDERVELEFQDGIVPEFEPGEDAQYYQFHFEDGRCLGRSPSLEDGDLPAPPREGELQETVLYSAALPDGRSGRYVALRENMRHDSEPKPSDVAEGVVTMVLGRATTDLDRTLVLLRNALWIAAAAAIFAAVGILAWTVPRALRPVQRFAGHIEALDASRLDARVDATNVPSELQPVALRLNELLERLRAAFEREKGITADVAHELRTPLSALQMTIEVALRSPRSDEEYRRALEQCARLNRQMNGLVAGLLRLARAESGQTPVYTESFDLVELAHDAAAPFLTTAGSRGLEWTWSTPDAAPIQADRELTRIVLQNLVENAVEYADEGGHVEVAVEGAHRIRVANPASRMNEQDVTRVFDRFWRGDQARSGIERHGGLGLSISKTLVELMGGSLSAAWTDGIFAVSLDLPYESVGGSSA